MSFPSFFYCLFLLSFFIMRKNQGLLSLCSRKAALTNKHVEGFGQYEPSSIESLT